MGITQVELTSIEVEEIVDTEDNEIAEEEGLFGPPQPVTIAQHVKLQMEVSEKVPNPPLIPVHYPKVSRELRSLTYRTAPAPKWMARET
jgi:hypothetical protein